MDLRRAGAQVELSDWPLITVVTPCLNAAATIERTLESVDAQEYPNLQHIVVDGGSTDGTLDIVRAHPRVELISEPDDGLSDALNKGLRRARGDLVGELNADDLYLPGALFDVAQAFRESPDVGWVTGHCKIIDGDDREIRRAVTRYKSALLRRYSYPLFLTQNFISTPATFLTRRGLEQVGEARLDLRNSMDYDLWLRAGRLGAPAIVPREIAAFRMVEGTLSMVGFERQFKEHAAVAASHAVGLERIPAMVNQVLSVLIVLIYRTLAFIRKRRGGSARS